MSKAKAKAKAQIYGPTKTIGRAPKSKVQYPIQVKRTISGLNQEVGVRVRVRNEGSVRVRLRGSRIRV